jgi:hypothetical protein
LYLQNTISPIAIFFIGRRFVKNCIFFLSACSFVRAEELGYSINNFLQIHCYDCHGDGAKKGGLAMDQISFDLEDPVTFATWERIYDRAISGEMPPRKILDRPKANELVVFSKHLEPPLVDAHLKEKGTVLRRLNRQEYENTLNDLMGTNLRLASFYRKMEDLMNLTMWASPSISRWSI